MPVHAGIQELLEQVTLNEFLQFAVLGLGAGSAYVLLGQGLVVIYRGAGIVNFAQGAMAMVAAFAFWDLHEQRGWAFWPAFLCGVALAAALGALTHLLVMRPMRGASPLARLIATLGVLSVLTAAAILRYGTVEQIVRTSLPDDVWTVNWLGLDVAVSADRIWLLAIAVALTLGLSVLYGHTRFGVAVSAAAENELAASTLGWSPDVLATVNWTIGAALAGVAGILIVALSGLQVYTLTLIVIAALAAALVGGFRSFPLVLVGGLGIGILQSEMSRYASDLLGPTRQQGFAQALPFGVIIVVLVVRGAGLPLRSYVLEKRPRLGTGVIRPLPIAVASAVVAAGALTVFSADVLDALLATALAGMIVLSLVVLTGYAGQVSLAQYALAGMGAFVAGRLVVATHWPFELAFLAGILATIPVGIVFAIPALRTRGVNLAVVTLGLGLAVQLVLFNNSEYTGGIAGTPVGRTEIFGISIDAVLHEDRYLVFVLFWFVLACLAVANLRRSRAGRRLIAVRTNERAAASLGISVFGAKLHAFAVSAGIAGLGGILIGFRSRTIIYSDFGVFQSINSVLEAVIGGVGYIVGTLIGAQFAPDAIGGLAVEQLVDNPGQWLVLIAGVLVLVVLILKPDGIASVFDRTGRRARRQSEAAAPLAAVARQRVRPAALEVEDLCVRIGGLEILRAVSLTIRPGEVVALIGPNGAGKTMAIDAITGFTKASGSIRLDGVDLAGWSAVRRARAGLTRSFQSLELFEDVTVRENLQTACDARDRAAYLSGLVWPGRQRLHSAAVAAVLEFDLEADLDRRPAEMPYGRRRLVAIARAVATEPSVLLLDEPAAGLDDAESADLARLIRLLADEWEMAVLLVEHDMSMVMSVSDRIVVLESGRAIAEGPADVVRSDRAVQLAYLGEPVETVVGATPDAPAADGARDPTDVAALLEVRGLSCGYGSGPVVRDLDLRVEAGEVVALLGPNGAGKTTTLLTISGALPAHGGEVLWRGDRMVKPLHARARSRLAFVPEERSVFMGLSVRDNLRVGGVSPDEALALFPELEPRLRVPAGLLSGGEQQMLTLARALARRPDLLLADELSLGLAPLVVQRLLRAVRDAADRGLGVLLVEQQIGRALDLADRVYVMRHGRVVMSAAAAEARAHVFDIAAVYLPGDAVASAGSPGGDADRAPRAAP